MIITILRTVALTNHSTKAGAKGLLDLIENFLDGMRRLGIQQVYDQMCDPLGSTMTLHSIDHLNQSRADARIAIYDPIFGPGGTPRSNLHVLVENTVTKILTSVQDGVVVVDGVDVSALSVDVSK
jgi:hypothetical protein